MRIARVVGARIAVVAWTVRVNALCGQTITLVQGASVAVVTFGGRQKFVCALACAWIARVKCASVGVVACDRFDDTLSLATHGGVAQVGGLLTDNRIVEARACLHLTVVRGASKPIVAIRVTGATVDSRRLHASVGDKIARPVDALIRDWALIVRLAALWYRDVHTVAVLANGIGRARI